jgi:hypothetical protein
MALRFLNSGYFAGKVGIGIETPTAPLDVFGVRAGRDWALTDRAVIRLDSNGTSIPSDILFGHTAAANQTSWTGAYWSLSSRGSTAGNKFIFYRGNGNPDGSSEATIMTFDPALRVGIGTTNPSSKLQVSANDGDGITLLHGTSNAFYILRDGSDDTIIKQTRSYTSKISISTLADSGTHESSGLNIVGQGVGLKSNVGIGTASPGAKLEVAGNTIITSAAGTTLKIEAKNDTAFNDPRIEFVTWNVASGASSGKIQLTNGAYNSNDMAFFTETDNSVTEKMRIASTGNVGINTTLPDFKLDVDGTFGVSNLPGNVTSTSALVRNETIGSEILSNPDFATNTAWGGSSSIANGQLTKTGGGLAYQTYSGLVSGAVYLVEVDVASIAGTANFYLGGTNSSPLIVGKQSFYQLGGSANLLVGFNNGYSGTTGTVFNSVSLKLVTSASDQIQTRQLGTGAFGPTPVGAYLPLTAGSGSPLTGRLDLTSTGGTGIRIVTGDTSEGYLIFGDAADNSMGGIAYNNNTNTLSIDCNNSERITILSTGDVGIGNTSPGFKLDVAGEGNFTSYLNVNSSAGIRSTGWVHLQRYATNLNVSVGNNGTNVHFLVPNGDIRIKTSLLSNQENTNIDASTSPELVGQVAISYTAAFFDFVVKKGTNVRSGTVYACHDGTNVEFTETSTNDLGDTSDVTLSVDKTSTNLRLLATVTSDDWTVKSLIRAI